MLNPEEVRLGIVWLPTCEGMFRNREGLRAVCHDLDPLAGTCSPPATGMSPPPTRDVLRAELRERVVNDAGRSCLCRAGTVRPTPADRRRVADSMRTAIASTQRTADSRRVLWRQLAGPPGLLRTTGLGPLPCVRPVTRGYEIAAVGTISLKAVWLSSPLVA